MKVEIAKNSGISTAQLVRLTEIEPKDATAIKFCCNMSEVVYSATVDGQGAALWGLVPPSILSDRAYLWLVTTDVANNHTFLMARYSRMIVEEMLQEHPILIGHCHIDDSRAHRWLKWLGAEFGFPEAKRIPFTIRRKHG